VSVLSPPPNNNNNNNNNDDSPSFSDFSAFGGWSSPTVKQYKGDTTLCSMGVDENYAVF